MIRETLFFALLLMFGSSHAQMTISGKVSTSLPANSFTFNVPFDCWYHEANSLKVTPEQNGDFTIELPVKKPQYIFLNLAGRRSLLYAEPGKSLRLFMDDSLKAWQFEGDLSRENEFRRQLGLTSFSLGKETWNDTLTNPEEILKVIRANQKLTFESLRNISFETSDDFIRMTKADIDYYAVSKIWDLIWKNGVLTGKNRSRFSPEDWKTISEKTYQEVEVSNGDAVSSYHYQIMVAYYSQYLQNLARNRQEFETLAEKVLDKPFSEIEIEYRKDKQYWDYSVLKYGFKDKALAYALASFVNRGINRGNLGFLNEAYTSFAGQFPGSIYLAHVKEIMKPYLIVQSTGQSETNIRFLENSEQIPSLDSIVKIHKGRVLYIDLWGTWCGPCRQEFAHTGELKERFRDKEVDFIYIAVEHSSDPEKKWRETIRFFDLAGYHVLAGKTLRENLIKIYAQNGSMQFPSYILVDKSGKIITLKAGRPSDKESLYRQIEQLL